jgi:hypothetical protein
MAIADTRWAVEIGGVRIASGNLALAELLAEESFRAG